MRIRNFIPEEDFRYLVSTQQDLLAPCVKDLKLTKNLKNSFAERIKKLYRGENSNILIVEKGKEKIGYVFYEFEKSEITCKKYIFVDSLFVNKSERRKGIGSKLMQKVKEEGKKEGCKGIRLNVAVRNKDAIKFFKKLGYRFYWYKLKLPI